MILELHCMLTTENEAEFISLSSIRDLCLCRADEHLARCTQHSQSFITYFPEILILKQFFSVFHPGMDGSMVAKAQNYRRSCLSELKPSIHRCPWQQFYNCSYTTADTQTPESPARTSLASLPKLQYIYICTMLSKLLVSAYMFI